MKGEVTNSQDANEVLYTLSAESKEQVDNWEIEVKAAGGKIISKPEEFGKGYYGFVFADPDGHRFNVFYMQIKKVQTCKYPKKRRNRKARRVGL